MGVKTFGWFIISQCHRALCRRDTCKNHYTWPLLGEVDRGVSHKLRRVRKTPGVPKLYELISRGRGRIILVTHIRWCHPGRDKFFFWIALPRFGEEKKRLLFFLQPFSGKLRRAGVAVKFQFAAGQRRAFFRSLVFFFPVEVEKLNFCKKKKRSFHQSSLRNKHFAGCAHAAGKTRALRK